MNDMADKVVIDDLFQRGKVEEAVTADVEAFPDLSATLRSNISKPSTNVDPEERSSPHIYNMAVANTKPLKMWFSTHEKWTSKPELRSVKSCPAGYPRLAATLASDENFMLYRRFGYLQARILFLNTRDELGELERNLDDFDAVDAVPSPSGLKSRERNEAKDDTRRDYLARSREVQGIRFRSSSIF